MRLGAVRSGMARWGMAHLGWVGSGMAGPYIVDPFECPNCHHELLIDRWGIEGGVNKATRICLGDVIDMSAYRGEDPQELERQTTLALSELEEWIKPR